MKIEFEKVEELIGKTLTRIDYDSEFEDEIIFHLDNGDRYKMYHSQDCCESVTVDDINGDFEDLIGVPLLIAEEATNSEENPEGVNIDWQESFTWTFYKFATIKGFVTIRWYGESNGYYSESVYFEKISR
tara:strand:+ start:7352 stop:7741 length:390 start_codon:yes stop_codon:yes gene_type:complete